ncbi:hypothetical protein ACLBOM_26020 [Escherichia coli]
MRRRSDGCARVLTDRHVFTGVNGAGASFLGSGLARLINDIPLPGTTGVERVLFRALGVSDREMNWKQYLCAILHLNMLGAGGAVFYVAGSALSARLIHSSCRGCRGIWR